MSQPRNIPPHPVAQGSSTKPTETPLVSSSRTPAVAGATIIDMPNSGKGGSPKEEAKTAPTPQFKATTTNPVAAVSSSATVSTNVTATNTPKESPKGTSQKVAVARSKADPANVDTAKVSMPAAESPAVSGGPVVKGKPEDVKRQKQQVQVSPPVAKSTKETPAVDPFDTLASSLPGESDVPSKPMFTGPKVKEPEVTSQKGVLCGVNDSSLPPGYRYPTTAPAGIPEKPINIPKPMSTNEALDSLSAGFSLGATPTKEQPMEVSASAGLKCAPSPPAHNKAPAPRADKKAKMDSGDSLSLMTGLDAPDATKPKTDEGGSMSLDALNALGDTLAGPEPVPDPPKLRPNDIVTEDKLKAKKGVRVGEREDTLPPDFRFKDQKTKELHPQKPEPSMDSGTALDILSGDFTASSTAPSKQLKVEDISSTDTLARDFVGPSQQAFGVHSPAPTSKKTEDDSMSLDALSALGDTLAGPEPVPDPPKLRPQDIVMEDKLKAEKGVRVGEREDTLPPEYRVKDDPLKDFPPHKLEPSMDSGEALDILSIDFMTSPAGLAVHGPGHIPCPKESADDFALDALAGDFVAPDVAPAVHSTPNTACHLSGGTDNALDALSDTLMDTSPSPAPAPISPKDMVKEKQIEEEKLIKMGERDDSLPPEHRPTEAGKKVIADAKAKAVPEQKSMDDTTALDILSGDFSTPAVPTAANKGVAAHAPRTEPLQPLPGPALDSLASGLLPDAAEVKPKGDTPKSKNKSRSKSKRQTQAEDPRVCAQLSSDVVQASSTPKGGKDF